MREGHRGLNIFFLAWILASRRCLCAPAEGTGVGAQVNDQLLLAHHTNLVTAGTQEGQLVTFHLEDRLPGSCFPREGSGKGGLQACPPCHLSFSLILIDSASSPNPVLSWVLEGGETEARYGQRFAQSQHMLVTDVQVSGPGLWSPRWHQLGNHAEPAGSTSFALLAGSAGVSR